MDKQENPPVEETNLTPAQLAAAAGAAPVTDREIDEDEDDDEDDGVVRTHARTRDPLLEEDGGKNYMFFEEMLWDNTVAFHPVTLRNMRSVITASLSPNDPGLPEFRNILTLDSVRAMNEALSYLGDTDMGVVDNPLIASSTEIVKLVEDWLFYRGIVENVAIADMSISDALNEENALRAIGQMAVVLAFPVECRVALAMRCIIAGGKSGLLIPAAAAIAAGRGKAAPQETIPHTVGAVVALLIANQTVGKRIEGLTGPMGAGYDQKITVESILNYEVPMNRDDVLRFLVGILYGSERIDPGNFPLMLIEKKKNQHQPQQQQQQQNNRHQQRGGKRRNNRNSRGGGGGGDRDGNTRVVHDPRNDRDGNTRG